MATYVANGQGLIKTNTMATMTPPEVEESAGTDVRTESEQDKLVFLCPDVLASLSDAATKT